MAYQNIDVALAGGFGKILQIAFSDGVVNQLSRDYRDFEMMQKFKVGSESPRELRFMLQESLSPASIGYLGVTSNFPNAYDPSLAEYIAYFKTIGAAVKFTHEEWRRANENPKDLKYIDPLLVRAQSIMDSAKRKMAVGMHNDGTGALGTVASITENKSGANIQTVDVVLSTADTAAGFIGWFQVGDLIVGDQADGNLRAPTETSGSSFFAWQVVSITRSTNTVRIKPVDSSLTLVADITASNLVANDVFYPKNQTTRPNRASIADYGTASEEVVGLEALAAWAGQVVWGMTQSGVLGSTANSVGGAISLDDIQEVMDSVKINVGATGFSWQQALTAPEVISSFILGRESDRRFQSMQDNVRGTTKFVFQHGNDAIELVGSEFAKKNRMWIIPESKGNGKILELHSSEFKDVSVGGASEFLQPASGGGYARYLNKFYEGYYTMLCKHPKAIAVVHNFTI